jgi:YrbI family 3-deoxy-D-manno-octulosonate 8-phosphate phosphatase
MDRMVVKLQILALIPARSGSKSVPGKNVKLLAGHPLLAFSIAAGLQAESVDRVLVSTDDERIAATARKYGAETPFLRPAELARDDTPDLPVFQHALDWLQENESYLPDLVIQLRPTSPLRPPGFVDEAVSVLREHPEADSARAVIPSGQNPYKMWRIDDEGHMTPLHADDFEEPYNMPRQELPATYWQTGHIDVIRRETIEAGSMTGRVVQSILIDPGYAVDIDSPHDHERAEWLIERGEMPLVKPTAGARHLHHGLSLLILDFDGVLTDNRVWFNASGEEWVAANRSDGWGIARLKEAGVDTVVLSTETNPVVAARCRKLGIDFRQGLEDKAAAVGALLRERNLDPSVAVFVGNDVNDIPAFRAAGYALAVADAHPEVKAAADAILRKPGGHGAVREICDILLRLREEKG